MFPTAGAATALHNDTATWTSREFSVWFPRPSVGTDPFPRPSTGTDPFPRASPRRCHCRRIGPNQAQSNKTSHRKDHLSGAHCGLCRREASTQHVRKSQNHASVTARPSQVATIVRGSTELELFNQTGRDRTCPSPTHGNAVARPRVISLPVPPAAPAHA